MKTQVDEKFATPFGLWLQQHSLFKEKKGEPRKGYVRHDIDIIWRNYMTGNWMIIEEKCLGRPVEWSQVQTYDILKRAIYGPRPGPEFLGFHNLIFENTTPDNGWIKWDGRLIDKDELTQIFKIGK